MSYYTQNNGYPKHHHFTNRRIKLNIGGFKYETKRSVLINWPDSRIANDIAENEPDELFYNRDGHLFWYILQFYRTGLIHLPLGNSSSPCSNCGQPTFLDHLRREFEYFRMPFSEPVENRKMASSNIMESLIASRIDEFLSVLKKIFMEVVVANETKVEITFAMKKTPPEVRIIGKERLMRNSYLYEKICEMVTPFSETATRILDMFYQEIGQHMEENLPGLMWRVDRNYSSEIGNFHNIRMQYQSEGGIIRDVVVANSKLAKVIKM
ncbi:10134_t:CDS:2 [Ambispora gerdemannii]|uniref:10134_t:CDS:1 n=1 Tax=Ambispora gerdemannii TaxID=144530 RepID=A0A9N8YPB1_9GLOM|nr:10134_t:CDS:2 [Ambispora gerdemannii]